MKQEMQEQHYGYGPSAARVLVGKYPQLILGLLTGGDGRHDIEDEPGIGRGKDRKTIRAPK